MPEHSAGKRTVEWHTSEWHSAKWHMPEWHMEEWHIAERDWAEWHKLIRKKTGVFYLIVCWLSFC